MDGIDEAEAREEYIMTVNQIFNSEEQDYEHYNKYAKEKEFSVRLDRKSMWMGPKKSKENGLSVPKKATVCRSILNQLSKRRSHGRGLVWVHMMENSSCFSME